MNAPIASVDMPTEWKFLPSVDSSGEPSGTAATSCGVIKSNQALMMNCNEAVIETKH